MNKWNKLGLTVGMCTAVVSATHFVNKFIFSASVSKGLTQKKFKNRFHWKFGDIIYSVKGKGTPILLIHDLNSYSSLNEWSMIVEQLSKDHKVFMLDLLGCGQSDKPNITYTAYMYTQLLNDFISNIIKESVSVIVTGDSVPMTIMTAYIQPKLFKKIIMINPQNMDQVALIPTKQNNMLRKIYNSPIFGTLLYNIKMSRHELRNHFVQHTFYNPSTIPHQYLEECHETSHINGENAKYLFSSIECNFTTVSIEKALSNLDQSLYLIYGNKETGIKNTVTQYISVNPAIEKACIYNTKHLPQLERPHEFLNYIKLFLND